MWHWLLRRGGLLKCLMVLRILSDKGAKGDPYRKYSFRVFLEPPKRHAPKGHASPFMRIVGTLICGRMTVNESIMVGQAFPHLGHKLPSTLALGSRV